MRASCASPLTLRIAPPICQSGQSLQDYDYCDERKDHADHITDDVAVAGGVLHCKQDAGDEAEALREQNGESGVHMTHPGGRGSGVKKLIRLPSGSRNSIDRLPQG